MESEFTTKFDSLNSQPSSQDIIWSSSDSSDSENVSKPVQLERTTVNTRSRKRKHSKTSGNKRKNLSHLDINFSDSVREKMSPKSKEEVYQSTSKECISPILNFSHLKRRNTNTNSSPILPSRNLKYTEKTSPILCSQNITPKCAVKVRKNLFNNNSQLEINNEIITIINPTKSRVPISNNTVDRKQCCNKNVQLVTSRDMLNHDKNQTIFENKTNIPNLKLNKSSIGKRIKLNDNININDAHSLMKEFYKNTTLRTTNLDVQNKVESYFDYNFNTQLLSQHSISEYESTPPNSSKTSEEIDTISLTQEQSHSREVLEKSPKHLEITNKSKKIKYKKDGLAYKLNSLLKKQNANVSLWQHERFLALNSNFIIPAGEYKAFQIQNIQFKYGVYLLEGKDVNNEKYLILINSSLVSERQIKQDVLLKLYVPFKILTLENNDKLIVNASKFEVKEIL